MDGCVEGQGADQRHRNDFPLGHDLVQVRHPDRDKINLWPSLGKVVKASLEGQQRLVRTVALAFWEKDERGTRGGRLDHLFNRIPGPHLGTAVNKDGVEYIASYESAKGRGQPVVQRGNRPGATAQRCWQNSPKQDEIGIGRVVGEIYALARQWLDALPDGARRGHEPREDRDRPGRQGRPRRRAGLASFRMLHSALRI